MTKRKSSANTGRQPRPGGKRLAPEGADRALQQRQVIRHPLWGALKGTMKIAPGTDVTQPADPDWGKD
jgi:hypothetical protein